MGRFVRGDVVAVPFPFSDLTGHKHRPALVITDLRGDDVILCQITTRPRNDGYSIFITDADFERGGLRHDSAVRPNRLFTADENTIQAWKGKLLDHKITK